MEWAGVRASKSALFFPVCTGSVAPSSSTQLGARTRGRRSSSPLLSVPDSRAAASAVSSHWVPGALVPSALFPLQQQTVADR